MHSATVNAKPDNATGELVYHHENPIGPQFGRFATEQIATPQAVLGVPKKRKPARATRTRFGAVVHTQNSANDILVDRDSENQRDLLGDAGTAPAGIAALHGDHGINELFIRPFRARPGAAFGRKQLAILPFAEQAVETQQSRGFQNNSRTKSPRGADEERAQPGKDPICGAQVGGPLAPAMEDQQL